MRRIALLLTATGLALATLPADAAPPKPVEETFTFTDPTADMTSAADLTDSTMHCSGGVLPEEAPHKFVAGRAGTLKVSISGFQGDWALELRDPKKARVLGGDDVNPPDFETVVIKVNAPGPVNVLPCNLAGTIEATVKLVFTPRR